ncbi:MAG: GGDEF domain-containing protein [Lachnospiraceae bacterium]|nr:GGDEF domain-containing protein [Lachnospiraceae bacterium]
MQERAYKKREMPKEAEEWNKVVFATLWRVWILSAVAALLLVLFYQPTQECTRLDYLQQFFLKPAIGGAVVVGVYRLILLYAGNRVTERCMAAISMVMVNLYILVMAVSYTNIKVFPIILVAPIAIASVYRQRIFIMIQTAGSVLIYLLYLYVFVPQSAFDTLETEVVDVIVFLFVAIAYAIMVEQIRKSTIALDLQGWKDSLTHMYNHEAFYEELENYMKRYKEKGETFSILIADIDNFKKVNDTYGHAYGDEVIREVASVFEQCKGKREFASRYGGEEFALIMPGRDKKDAVLLADKIRREFEKRKLECEGEMKSFTISIGVAEYAKEYPTASLFFEQADKALYDAKVGGKNKVCCSAD